MTVKELIAALQQIPNQDAEVFVEDWVNDVEKPALVWAIIQHKPKIAPACIVVLASQPPGYFPHSLAKM